MIVDTILNIVLAFLVTALVYVIICTIDVEVFYPKKEKEKKWNILYRFW